MQRFQDKLPEFYEEVRRALAALDRNDLLSQLPNLTLREHRGEADAFWLYFGGIRELNTVERNIVGVGHGESVALDAPRGIVVLDADNFGRVLGIELMDRPDVFARL